MGRESSRSAGRSKSSWARAFVVGCALTTGAVSCAARTGTIGTILVQKGDGRLFLDEVPKGLGAAEAGLRAGDEILLIEGRDVRELSPAEIHEALAGPVGEPVRLTVVRGERVLRVTVARTPKLVRTSRKP